MFVNLLLSLIGRLFLLIVAGSLFWLFLILLTSLAKMATTFWPL